jgi:hypothetical protein
MLYSRLPGTRDPKAAQLIEMPRNCGRSSRLVDFKALAAIP